MYITVTPCNSLQTANNANEKYCNTGVVTQAYTSVNWWRRVLTLCKKKENIAEAYYFCDILTLSL